jgi:hypothetical protein
MPRPLLNQPNPAIQRLYPEANEAWADPDYWKSFGLMEKAIRKDPHNPSRYLHVARGYGRRNLPFWPVSIVRKTIAIVGLVLCSALLLPVGFVADRGVAVAFLIATCIAPGLFISNVWAITQTLAESDVAGKWTGIQNSIGNLDAVSPIATGFIVQSTGSFFMALVIAAAVLVLGAAAYRLLMPKRKGVLMQRVFGYSRPVESDDP